MARRKRFNSENVARSFAKKVNGKVNDLRKIAEAKSPWTVTYESNTKTKAHGQRISDNDWCPEESNIAAVIDSACKCYKYKGVYFKRNEKNYLFREYHLATGFTRYSNVFHCQTGLHTIKQCKDYINHLLNNLKKDKQKLSKVSEKFINSDYVSRECEDFY